MGIDFRQKLESVLQGFWKWLKELAVHDFCSIIILFLQYMHKIAH